MFVNDTVVILEDGTAEYRREGTGTSSVKGTVNWTRPTRPRFFALDSDAGKEWLDQRCHQLKQEGGAAVLASLVSLDMTDHRESVRETHRRETNYFRNHQHKMDPRYLAAGCTSVRGRWRAPARRWSATVCAAVACVGAHPAATPSATCDPSSSASVPSGIPSGTTTPTKGKD
ncbi:MAG: hypothetical protein H6822_26630 [Planctomycetaceae bacterium]|nr:hypothetical protein [Planctomycetales bacterium]MCB9925755.1 hypothetical protein [Planctomycetaceae bacterium]